MTNMSYVGYLPPTPVPFKFAASRRYQHVIPSRRLGFDRKSGYVGFMVDKVALGGGFVPLPILILQTAQRSSHRRYISSLLTSLYE
jgi:hypothetical protein